jgi:hypothetical protein
MLRRSLMTRHENDGTIVSRNFKALSAFRIVFSLYLFCDFLAAVYPYFDDLYGDTGVLPISALTSDHYHTGLVFILPLLKILDAILYRPLFTLLYSVALFAFAIGYRTRWSNAFVFLLNSYLYWRNPSLNSGAETLAHLLLLWCLFLPMARYWSVDAALDERPRDRPYPALPFLALRVQIGSLYIFSALFKMSGLPWVRGSAVTWALSDHLFGATSPGLFLIHQTPALAIAADYAVVGFQLAFPFLVYCPWRNDLVRALALGGSSLMHISFIFLLNVAGFPYLCLTMLLLLVPDTWIEVLLRKRNEKLASVAIYFEPGCDFCRRIALILREFLVSLSSVVAPASVDPQVHRMLSENNSWVVHGADGKFYLKWKAMDYLLRCSLFFAPMAWFFELPFMRAPMEKLYDLIGKNRRNLAPATKLVFGYRSPAPVGRLGLSVCFCLMAFAVFGNVFSVTRPRLPDLRRFDEILDVLQVKQSWELFAPVPPHFRYDYRGTVHMADGSVADMNTLLPAPLFWTDQNMRITFASPRWLKYFTRLDQLTDETWASFGHYLCRKAQTRGPQKIMLQEVEITSIIEPIAGTPPYPQPIEHRIVSCSETSAQALIGGS